MCVTSTTILLPAIKPSLQRRLHFWFFIHVFYSFFLVSIYFHSFRAYEIRMIIFFQFSFTSDQSPHTHFYVLLSFFRLYGFIYLFFYFWKLSSKNGNEKIQPQNKSNTNFHMNIEDYLLYMVKWAWYYSQIKDLCMNRYPSRALIERAREKKRAIVKNAKRKMQKWIFLWKEYVDFIWWYLNF